MSGIALVVVLMTMVVLALLAPQPLFFAGGRTPFSLASNETGAAVGCVQVTKACPSGGYQGGRYYHLPLLPQMANL